MLQRVGALLFPQPVGMSPAFIVNVMAKRLRAPVAPLQARGFAMRVPAERLKVSFGKGGNGMEA